MKNNYNERSWAIDVITEINLIVSQRKKTIRRAGGERTLKASTKSNSLFPDVLLFQDEENLRILQGWELKMPDTPITDGELLLNATKKANLLGLNSFLVWNVTEAALYVLEDGEFKHKAQWSNLSDITKRSEVELNRGRWKKELEEIIETLESFFTNGEIKSQNIVDSFSENKIIDVITGNVGLVKQKIADAAKKDAVLSASIKEWWESVKIEYSSEPDEFSAVSKLALIAWVNRFLFTHYLKKFTNKALEIDEFSASTTLSEAKEYFQELTRENDFLNVYAAVIGEEFIDDVSWEQILQLNFFLSELKLQDIDQGLLQQFFEQLLLTSKRKAAGQYATPYPLADYLARILILDKTLAVMDPFCGTGTLLRASYDVKTEFGVSPQDSIKTIWGSDKFSFPLHMSTLSLAKPEIVGQVINVFKSDVIDLAVGKSHEFTDPTSGELVQKALPMMDYFISNLPFVNAAKIRTSNPDIFFIKQKIAISLGDANFDIPAKSDLIAYLPHYLWHLLNDDGRIGLIVSNSWLGTEWGEHFKAVLNRFFKIDKVVTSGSGKWFNNADVVTNVLILDKRKQPTKKPGDDEETSFVTLKIPVQQLSDKKVVEQAANQTLLKKEGHVRVIQLKQRQMSLLNSFGLNWSSYFADLNWFQKASNSLVKVNTLFEVNRGERRGWDKMFYPNEPQTIEAKYLRPVLKNFRSVKKLVAQSQGTAFCCSSSIQNLQNEGSTGALAWIRKFENGRNGVGEPLTQSLERPNHYWYEMKDTTVADLVATINYGETLFVAKMAQRSFVNQRLIRFTAVNSGVDIELCHALMNSYIGIFYIEALGFGRGLGALDLSSTKVRDNFFILNPDNLNDQQKREIKNEFSLLFNRDVKKVPVEVELNDRKKFELVVAKAYGLDGEWEAIKNSLLSLYKIRMSVNSK